MKQQQYWQCVSLVQAGQLTSGFGVFLKEVRDSFLSLESLIIFNKDGERVAPQRRHISIDGHWVGTYHGRSHRKFSRS